MKIYHVLISVEVVIMLKNKVISKYFCSTSVMDDSLSDFKEKKNLAGPKTQKSGITQKKQRIKKLKGQKDIRSVLHSKKSDIVKYTEEFNKVCIKSGLDVDSEQLQIAIALSKSATYEGVTPSSDIPKSSSSQNSQDRVANIRRTLSEYGFKVPEIKIINTKGKKNKKYYKLLLTTESERQQIIADKYSQVLFESISKIELIDSKPHIQDQNKLYYLTTNISYEEIRDNNIFYVQDLVEISANSIGSLLKDWSLIPGRPSSPVKQEYKMNFNQSDHSQHERDTILGGTLKNTKEILKRKQQNIGTDQFLPTYNILIPNPSEVTLLIDELPSENDCINRVHNDKTNSEKSHKCRSASPDLFEDDISIAIDVTKETTNSQQHTDQFNDNNKSEGMELTVCAGGSQKSNVDEGLTQVNSQDITKRRSNDPMEITDCVATSSQPLFVNVDEDKDVLNITTEPVINPFNNVNCDYQPDIVYDELNPLINIIKDKNDHCSKAVTILNFEPEVIDDVQSSDTSIIDLCDVDKHYSISNYTSPLSEIAVTDEVVIENKNNKSIDLTQIYDDVNDSLPSVQLCSMKKVRRNKNLIETDTSSSNVIIIDDNPIIEIMESKPISKKKQRLIKIQDSSRILDDIDLTQPSLINTTCRSRDTSDLNSTQPIFVDPSVESPSSKITVVDDLSIDFHSDESDSVNFNSHNEEFNNIYSNDLVKDINDEALLEPISVNNLGKENDVSIDYDDIPNIDTIIADITSENHILNNSDDVINDENFSQNSEDFHVSDNEFNYSVHKSNQNFDLGGLSVMNDLSNVRSDEPKKELSLDLEIPLTPSKETKISFSTPTTSDYIIKTNEVTPMPDYASMPTEERNKELDKYGLKPFKRKRAVQLLTYIYNQMHPAVEAYSEEPEIKKFRHNTKGCGSSPKNNINIHDKESSESIKPDDVKNTDIYQITSEVPELNHIQCDADDWVFQKKEKSKVHSCRVPLHIAFYNYVSCRRLLREAMLRYEPVNIALIHKDLVGYGHRYDPKDLLKFMDKRCITVKTLEKSKNR